MALWARQLKRNKYLSCKMKLKRWTESSRRVDITSRIEIASPSRWDVSSGAIKHALDILMLIGNGACISGSDQCLSLFPPFGLSCFESLARFPGLIVVWVVFCRVLGIIPSSRNGPIVVFEFLRSSFVSRGVFGQARAFWSWNMGRDGSGCISKMPLDIAA